MIASAFQIPSRVIGEAPVGRANIFGLCAGQRLDRLRAAGYVIEHPLLSSFALGAFQLDVTVGVIFQFVSVMKQLLGGVEAGHTDVFLVAAVSPGLRRQPPSDDKKSGFDAVRIEHADQTRPGMLPFAAEQNVWPRTVIEG